MARLPQQANTGSNKEQLGDFSAMPAGKYLVMITKSGFKKTNAGTGHYLKLTFKVIEGDRKGKLIWENLNLDNPNPQAVEIANKALNTICQACDKVGVEDSEELHGIPMLATVAVKKATANHPASNEIKFYEKADGATAPADTSEKKEGATSGDKLPWEK